MGKKYKALVIILIILVVLIVAIYLVTKPKHTSEEPGLIEITNLTPTSVVGKVAHWTDNLNAPSGFELEIESEDYIWQDDDLNREMTVFVLCLVEEYCSNWIDETYTELSFTDFVEAEKACADMYSGGSNFCPYYNLGAFNLFDVTWENGQIIKLKQRYTP